MLVYQRVAGSNPLSKTVTKYPSTNRVQLHSSALLDHSCASKTGSTVQLSNARLWRTVLARSTAPDMEMRLDLVRNQSPGLTKSTYTWRCMDRIWDTSNIIKYHITIPYNIIHMIIHCIYISLNIIRYHVISHFTATVQFGERAGKSPWKIGFLSAISMGNSLSNGEMSIAMLPEGIIGYLHSSQDLMSDMFLDVWISVWCW